MFFADGVTGLKELAFLRDLAEQNSAKYGVPDRTTLPVIKGSMMVLNQLSNLETSVGRFYTNLPNHMIDEAVFSLPFSDEMGDGKCWKDLITNILSQWQGLPSIHLWQTWQVPYSDKYHMENSVHRR